MSKEPKEQYRRIRKVDIDANGAHFYSKFGKFLKKGNEKSIIEVLPNTPYDTLNSIEFSLRKMGMKK